MNAENLRPLEDLIDSKSLESIKLDRKQAIAARARWREEGAAMERERSAGEKAAALSPIAVPMEPLAYITKRGAVYGGHGNPENGDRPLFLSNIAFALPDLQPDEAGYKTEYNKGFSTGWNSCREKVADINLSPRPAAADAGGLLVKVERNRVWIVKGVQSFMLAYEADTDEELQWYAEQLRKAISSIPLDVKTENILLVALHAVNDSYGVTDNLNANGCEHGIKPAKLCGNPACADAKLHRLIEQALAARPAAVMAGDLSTIQQVTEALDQHWLAGSVLARIQQLIEEREQAIEGRHPIQVARRAAMGAGALSDAYRALQNCLLVVPEGQFKRDMDNWLTARLGLEDGPADVPRPTASGAAVLSDDQRDAARYHWLTEIEGLRLSPKGRTAFTDLVEMNQYIDAKIAATGKKGGAA